MAIRHCTVSSEEDAARHGIREGVTSPRLAALPGWPEGTMHADVEATSVSQRLQCACHLVLAIEHTAKQALASVLVFQWVVLDRLLISIGAIGSREAQFECELRVSQRAERV